jgi:starvation-inducible DNA-binding protein
VSAHQLSQDHHPTLRHVDREAIGTIRERMDRLEDVDTVTADILHGVVAGLEENLWMIRVQA